MPNLMYYNAYSNNFGDEISPIVSEHCLKNKSRCLSLLYDINMNSINWKNKIKIYENNMSAIGSIYHLLPTKCTIWGTGCVKRYCTNIKKKNWDVRCTRGPLSRDVVIQTYKCKAPYLYGDPGVLISDVPEFKSQKYVKKRHIGLIPHFNDIQYAKETWGSYEIMEPTNNYKEVIKFINESEIIATSSLHGIIVSESFGVPVFWLGKNAPSQKSEGGVFKYQDYFLSTQRDFSNGPCLNVKTAMKDNLYCNYDSIQKLKQTLYSTFPYDIFA